MLSNKALLVHLSISQWTGRKLDKKATGAVEGQFSTEGRVGQYTKKLLPGASELKQIHALAGNMRDFVYKNTLPWMSDGTRILSSKNYMDFVKEYRSKKQAFDMAVDLFLKQYPTLREQAREKLGDLFNDLEYPAADALRRRFNCDVTFLPLPEVGDFRTEVSDSEKSEFEAKMRQVEIDATRECFRRLSEVVTTAAETLSKPDAIFRDSLIKNISSICDLLPKLNITDDAALEKTRREVEALVAKISPDGCRDSAQVRADAAKKLKDINDKMGAFMGGGISKWVA